MLPLYLNTLHHSVASVINSATSLPGSIKLTSIDDNLGCLVPTGAIFVSDTASSEDITIAFNSGWAPGFDYVSMFSSSARPCRSIGIKCVTL